MRASVSFLKRLGFLNEAGEPNDEYAGFRAGSPDQSKRILAKAIKLGFSDLFKRNEKCYKEDEKMILGLVAEITKRAKNNRAVEAVTKTFIMLCNMADFSEADKDLVETNEAEITNDENATDYSDQSDTSTVPPLSKLGLAYTINIHLPATKDTEVYHAIFSALKGELVK